MSDAVVTRLRVPAGARTWRVDAAVLALLAIVIRLPAYLADAHLTYDDGVFGASALLLRDGELPYRDIFSPQGPLFLPLVWLGDLVGLRTANAPRVLALAAGAVVTVATYATGRRITGRGGAILAAGLVTTSGSVLWTTAPVAADGPALALATSAVALAFGYRERPTTARAIAIGVVMGAALCVKVLVLPALIPVGVLLLSRRRSRDVALAVGAAALAGVAATAPWGFDRVWDQYIEYHRGSARISSHTGAARKLVTTLLERDPFVVAAGVLAAVTAGVRRHRPARREPAPPGGDATMRLAAWLLAAWAAAVAAVLILEPAFWRPQLAEIVPPLALLAALRPAPPAALAVAFVAVAPWFLAHVNPILWPDDYDAREAAAVDDLGALPDDSAVITDDPGLAWRAERRVPGDLVDSSIKRIEQGQITTGVIVDTARDDDVCAVLVWHDRYADLPGLGAELERSGYEEAARYGDERVLYTKGECPASSTR
ncbi:MAG TPA: glycosyltransferase family 39 protein [Acidimicrobiia bacterium]